jgi:predicted metal-dependent peptidase
MPASQNFVLKGRNKMSKLSAPEAFARARISLLKTHPFWGALSLRLEPVFTKEVDVSATDGRRILINPRYAETANQDLMRYLIYHEVSHCAYGHLWRVGNRDPQLWNIAADVQIHNVGEAEGFSIDSQVWDNLQRFLHGLVHRGIGSFKDDSAEKIYEILKDTMKQQKPAGGTGDSVCVCGRKCFLPAAAATEGESSNAIAREWQAAVAEAATLAGNVPGSLKELIQSLNKRKVDWRKLLVEFFTRSVGGDYVWLPPNRRFVHSGQYLPSNTKVCASEIAIAIDTSGSMTKEMLAAAWGEVNNLRDTFVCAVHLFQVDYSLQSYEFFHEQEPLPQEIEARGRGGTSFNPVFYEIQKRGISPQLLLYFTDGQGEVSVDPPPYPTLWVLIPYQGIAARFNPHFGEVLRVEDE